jgi:hypothetical protein
MPDSPRNQATLSTTGNRHATVSPGDLRAVESTRRDRFKPLSHQLTIAPQARKTGPEIQMAIEGLQHYASIVQS